MAPKVDVANTTPQAVRPLQQDLTSFFQGLLQAPTQPFISRAPPPGIGAGGGSFTSPFFTGFRQLLGGGSQQQFSGNPFAQFLNQPLRGESTLQGLAGGAGLQAANQVIGAAQPIFHENLQSALGSLSAAAPGVLSSAFAQQGTDLTSAALRDFNLFQQQALQQGQQTALQAASTLGELGLGANQQFINPTLQLLLAAAGFAQPSGQAVVKPGILDYVTQLATAGAAAYGARGG